MKKRQSDLHFVFQETAASFSSLFCFSSSNSRRTSSPYLSIIRTRKSMHRSNSIFCCISSSRYCFDLSLFYRTCRKTTLNRNPKEASPNCKNLSGIIKEYHSDHCLDYAKVQETLGTIYLMTANLPQAKTHFKRAFKIYEKIWADELEMIEAKYQEIQELYPQVGFFLGQQLSDF